MKNKSKKEHKSKVAETKDKKQRSDDSLSEHSGKSSNPRFQN